MYLHEGSIYVLKTNFRFLTKKHKKMYLHEGSILKYNKLSIYNAYLYILKYQNRIARNKNISMEKSSKSQNQVKGCNVV